jgi:hypothetical protein
MQCIFHGPAEGDGGKLIKVYYYRVVCIKIKYINYMKKHKIKSYKTSGLRCLGPLYHIKGQELQ